MGKDSLLNNYAPDHPFVTGEGLGGFDSYDSPEYVEYEYEDFEDDGDEEDSRTYDGWLSVGRQVQRGEKSHRSNGRSLFYFSQTKPVETIYDEDEEWDDNDELTYDEWQENGYQVMRGEKSHKKGGKALFYFSQTMAI